jgi:hypothetical protein
MNDNISWAADWRCPDCGESVPIEPAQDTRPIREAHTCDPLALKRAQRDDQVFALDLTAAEPSEHEHECVFVEEQEPSGRLILPPCLVCGLTALDALEQLRGER